MFIVGYAWVLIADELFDKQASRVFACANGKEKGIWNAHILLWNEMFSKVKYWMLFKQNEEKKSL